MDTLISGITRIDPTILRDADRMEGFGVAQKISWASARVTTRIEDIAYCLLGIFGVHMPMLYGEGQHAFIRLQEEIMKTTADHSIFAWISDTATRQGLLASSPAWFRRSGDIVCSRSLASTVDLFSATNKGIHLYLPTENSKARSSCLAILDCHYIHNDRTNMSIHLGRIHERENAFIRIWPDEMEEVDTTTMCTLKKENIFVKQERLSIAIPLYRKFIVSIQVCKTVHSRFAKRLPLIVG